MLGFPYWIFAIASVASAVRFLFVRNASDAIGPVIDSREADAAHLVMNGAMALMPVAAVAIWSGIALWMLAAALAGRFVFIAAASPSHRPIFTRRSRLTATAYHLLALLAMIYATYEMGHAAMSGPMGMENSRGAHPSTIGGAIMSALGILFLLDGSLILGAGLFAPKLVVWAQQAATIPRDRDFCDPPNFSVGAYFQAAFAHVVMDFGMAWMTLR